MENLSADVIQRAIEGDEEAFSQILEEYHQRVFYLVYRMVGNVEEAKDLTQEVFLRVWRALGRFQPQQKLQTWIYQIAVNLCIDYYRKKKRTRSVFLEDLGDGVPLQEEREEATSLEKQEVAERVWKVLNQLPPSYRAVLILRDMEGLAAKEIAPIISASYTTTRWRLHQARKMFRELWEKQETEDSGEGDSSEDWGKVEEN